MGVIDKIANFRNYTQAAFENGMDTAKTIHQKMMAEVPVNIVQELGFPEQTGKELKERHQRILNHVYGGACTTVDEFGKLVVKQIGELGNLVNGRSAPPPGASADAPKKKRKDKNKSDKKKKGKH